MSIRKRAAIGVAALSAATLAVTGVVGVESAGAAAKAKTPMVVVHINKKLKMNKSRVHAGMVNFKAVTSSGDHIIQVLRLHKGYPLQQAAGDVQKAFQGDLKAIHRVDHKISWRGGSETKPGKPGKFMTNLNKAGQYVVIDENSNALSFLKVVGKPKHQAAMSDASLRVYTYGFEASGVLPANGWVALSNHSDQPHFVEMDRVKQSTTPKDVRKFIKGGAQGQPAFAKHGSVGSGVMSPGSGQMFHLHLKPGKYLVACYWPDEATGMPHFFMGMWRLVEVG